MTYAVAQSIFYLVAGARRIQMFSEIERAHVGYGDRVIELERRISELNSDLQRLERRY